MTLTIDQTQVAAAVWVGDDIEPFEPTLRALRRAHRDLEIVVGYTGIVPKTTVDYGVEFESCESIVHLVREVSRDWSRHVLLVTSPVISPPGLLDRALPA